MPPSQVAHTVFFDLPTGVDCVGTRWFLNAGTNTLLAERSGHQCVRVAKLDPCVPAPKLPEYRCPVSVPWSWPSKA